MNVKVVRRFVNKNVKLVTEGYALYGRITELQDDCLIFESQNAISAISLDAVDTIVLSN